MIAALNLLWAWYRGVAGIASAWPALMLTQTAASGLAGRPRGDRHRLRDLVGGRC
jgi:hypothetical protein